jgi:predicted RNase H-like nuclease (RuvC/YqgF family)
MTTENQDAVPGGQPSGQPAEEMIPKSQVERLVAERHSKLDRRIADQERTLRQMESAISESERRYDELQETQFANDPDGRKTWQLKRDVERKVREIAKQQEELAKQRDDLTRDKDEVESFKKQKAALEAARTIAAKHEGVSPETLISLTDGSPEKMDALAKLIGKPKPVVQLDSGKTSGGGKRIYTQEEISDYNFWQANKADIDLARQEGRIQRS